MARGFGFEPGIEQAVRVFQQSAFEKVELHIILERSDGNNIAIVGPHGGIPFPFFDHSRISFQDQLTQAGQQRAASTCKLRDVGCDA